MNLKDFLKLAGQQGKVVIIGDDGNLKGVFLPAEEYQKLTGHSSERRIDSKEDLIEKANREILQAQLEEVISSSDGGTGAARPEPEDDEDVIDITPPAERIDRVLNKRAQELFKSIPNYNYTPPEVATTGDEEIKPNFEDI